MNDSNAYISKWWQRPQPAWVTILGSTILLMALLASWQVAQSVFASTTEATANTATASNQLLPYQGYLTNAQGQPLDGPQTIRVELFNASSGGTRLFGPETHTSVPVANGYFSIAIGSKTTGGIPNSLWENNSIYVQITINNQALTPRELIQMAPIAGMSLTSQSVSVQRVQTSREAETTLRNANSFVTELDTSIEVTRRSVIYVAYSGSIICTSDCYLKLYRDNTRILDGPLALNVHYQPIATQVIDVVDPGNYTYRLQVGTVHAHTQYQFFGSSFSLIAIPIE